MIDTSAFRSLSYGLYIVTAFTKDGKKVGCVANTFAQVASNPPMASVALNKANATTQAILETGRFAVSVLGQSATMELIGLFGFRSSVDTDKFDGIDHEICASNLPQVLADSVACFAVEANERVDAGTHFVFVGRVLEASVISDGQPMTYAYYHEVLRGKTPPKAASYVEDAPDASAPGALPSSARQGEAPDGAAGDDTDSAVGATVGAAPDVASRYGWRCTLCGYIVEMDELPEDFTCPMCGVGREMFERIEL